MTVANSDILVPLLYGIFGFFVAVVASRAISIAIFCVFVYVVLKILSSSAVFVDWESFKKLSSLLSQISSAMISVTNGVINSGNKAALLWFVFGGLCGVVIIYSRRR